MKGGVGKTTIAAMLARYLSLRDKKQIILVDMDPQGGASSILLGSQVEPPTLIDILHFEAEGIPSGELMNQAARKCRHDENIFVIPGHAELAKLANTGPRLSCLKYTLEITSFPENAVQIIDTGTHPTLVAMGIDAADVVLVPVMLSQQTAKPTINTLKIAVQYRRQRGALLPMGIGNANWESRELERWQRKLQASQALTHMGFEVLTGIPYSRTILRGRWRYGSFPKRFATCAMCALEILKNKEVDSDHHVCYYVCDFLVFSEGYAHIMRNPDHDHLYRIAESQGGYFTTQQAHQAGFSDERLSYYAKNGLFSRIRRGVYRLSRFPMSHYEDLIVAWLRTGPNSVVSHASALALYDLTDIIPSEVHVTVPRTASRRRDNIRLHTSHITPPEITSRDGLPVTTVTRTIADVARSGLAEEHVRQAIEEALDRGLTNASSIREAAERYGGRTRRLIMKTLNASKK